MEKETIELCPTANRCPFLDVLKGILIIFVVLGHYRNDALHDVIFLFHMPLFFAVSGYLLTKSQLSIAYVEKKCRQLIVPYLTYLLLDITLVRREYTIRTFLSVVWGGRMLKGVYWYITCYLFAIFLFVILKKIDYKKTFILIFVGGGIAVIESHIVQSLSFLYKPGIPWCLDVSLLALVYIAMGYYTRKYVDLVLLSKKYIYDLIAVAVFILLTVFIFFDIKYRFFEFDMKYIIYKNYFLVLIIPLAFGFVFVKCSFRLSRIPKLNNLLCYLGQCSMPIMFMHVPLNELIGDHGFFVYTFVGIGCPLLFNFLLGRNRMLQAFMGLQKNNGGCLL